MYTDNHRYKIYGNDTITTADNIVDALCELRKSVYIKQNELLDLIADLETRGTYVLVRGIISAGIVDEKFAGQ